MNKLITQSASRFSFYVVISQMNRRINVVLILCLIISFGCSDDSEVDTAAAQKGQMDGWAAYDKEDFAAALLHFERVIDLDATLADAHNGLGWTHLSISRDPCNELRRFLRRHKRLLRVPSDWTLPTRMHGLG